MTRADLTPPPPAAYSWRHFLVVLASAAIAAVPAIVVDPAVLHFVTNHPAVAAYYPVVLAVVATIARAYRQRAAGKDGPR